MYSILESDLKELSQILDDVKSIGIDYLNNLNDLPTSVSDHITPGSQLPETGYGTINSLELFKTNYQKLMVASSGPRYWGYVIGGTTPASIAGDWLTSVFDQNTQSIQGAGDISASIEIETIRLLLELLSLPDDFNGGFVSGATMSNFTGLAVARQWAGEKLGKDIAREGMSSDIVVMGAMPHSSVLKSLSMLGFGSNNVIKIKTLAGREAIDLRDLEAKLIQYSGKPVIINCSAGTVNTVDFDDISAIVELKKKYDFWLHVDAAFGGFAACSPEHNYLLKGWEQADSITIDCHKWMNVPYDSAIILTRKDHQKLQIQTFQNSNAPYLGDPMENFSYMNFLPENSRRFRALPAWLSLMAYGKDGFQWIIMNSIECAREFGQNIEENEMLELLAPVRLNVVCFGLKQFPERTNEFLSVLNSRGKVFMTPTVLAGKSCVRAAFVNYRTSREDINIAIEELNFVSKQLFGSK